MGNHYIQTGQHLNSIRNNKLDGDENSSSREIRCPPTPPQMSILTLTSQLGQNAGLGEEYAGSYPELETSIDPEILSS